MLCGTSLMDGVWYTTSAVWVLVGELVGAAV